MTSHKSSDLKLCRVNNITRVTNDSNILRWKRP